jgi:hypothetical protein
MCDVCKTVSSYRLYALRGLISILLMHVLTRLRVINFDH